MDKSLEKTIFCVPGTGSKKADWLLDALRKKPKMKEALEERVHKNLPLVVRGINFEYEVMCIALEKFEKEGAGECVIDVDACDAPCDLRRCRPFS